MSYFLSLLLSPGSLLSQHQTFSSLLPSLGLSPVLPSSFIVNFCPFPITLYVLHCFSISFGLRWNRGLLDSFGFRLTIDFVSFLRVSVGNRFGVLIELESNIPSDRRITLRAVDDSIYCRTGTGLRQ